MAEHWRLRAACRDMPVDMFFPTSADPSTAEDALEVCRGCEVREPCLGYALRHEDQGIWGGQTPPPQRKHARRAAGITLEIPTVVFPIHHDRPRYENTPDDAADALAALAELMHAAGAPVEYCLRCNRPFAPKNPQQRYCSMFCSQTTPKAAGW